MAEGGGLLNRYTVNIRIVGSNPIPSATCRPLASDSVRKIAVSLGIYGMRCPMLSVDIRRKPCQNHGLKHGSCRRNAVATDRLTVRAIIAAKPRATAYLVPDGRGLYLKVQPGGARSWLVRYQIAGKVHDLGLGSYPEISLADARQRALEARRVKANGADPLAARRAEREAKLGLRRPGDGIHARIPTG